MSMFGRFVGGAAGGAAQIVNKYIDEELAAKRAETLAALQRSTAKGMAQDRLDVENDPKNVAAGVARESAGVLGKAKAARQAELDGLTDSTYQGALREKGDRDAEDASRRSIDAKKAEIKELTPLEIEAINQKLNATMGAEAKRAGMLAEAQAKAGAKYRADPASEIKAKIAAIENSLGRKLTENETLALSGIVKSQRDPELDTETIVDEKMNPDGTVTKTTRKQVRKPGSGQGQSEDPMLKALESIRAGKAEKGSNPIPTSPIAGRPYLQVDTPKLRAMLDSKLSSRERNEVLMEIDRRKSGDIR